MQITSGKVVLIDYTLTDDENEVIDSSRGGDPLAYVQGAGQIVPGLEKALDGRSVGDTVKVSVPPEEGYGLHDEEYVAVISKDQIEGFDDLEVGTQLHTDSENGEQTVIVTKIDADEVTIDANHPLAGMTLHFEVTVRDVQEFDEEALSGEQ